MKKTLSFYDIKEVENLLKGVGNLRLPYKLAYAIGKNLLLLKNEILLIENGEFKLIAEYAEKDENGQIKIDEENRYHIPENKIVEYNEEYKKYLSTTTEVELYSITQDALDELVDSDCDLLTGIQLANLNIFFVE